MTIKLPGMKEKEFQRQVVQFACLTGWLVYHTHDSRRSAAGFPDLVLVRERVVYAELKSAKGKLKPDQVIWIRRLEAAGQEVYIWRPSDWNRIEQLLR